MRKIFFIVCFLLVLLPIWAWGATYYVAQSSAGSGDGTSYANRASVSYHNAGTGVFAALDDDTVYLCDTINSTTVIPPDSGTSGHVVTYRGDYTGHDCTINTSTAISGTSLEYVTFTGSIYIATEANISAVHFKDCNHLIIDDCQFYQSTYMNKLSQAIKLEATNGGGGVSYITIQNCTIDGYRDGIQCYTSGDGYSTVDRHSNITVTGNEIKNGCQGYDDYFEMAYRVQYAWKMRMPGNFTITDNYIHDERNCAISCDPAWGDNLIARNRCIDNGGGDQTNVLQISMARGNTIIEDNYISGVDTVPVGDGHAIIIDHAMRTPELYSIGVIVRRNFCRGALGPARNCAGLNLYSGQNCKVYGNVFVGNKVGIVCKGRSWNTGNVFYNNTIADNTVYGIKLWDEYESSAWRNNIIANNAGEAWHYESGALEQDEKYTLYYNNSGGFSNAYSADATDINDNPDFTDATNDDYTLTSGSPAKDAGTSLDNEYHLGLHPDTDWSSTPPDVITVSHADQGPDWEIGAYVYPTGPIPVATVTGTAVKDGVLESEILTGGGTIIITLSNAEWEATVGANNALTTALQMR